MCRTLDTETGETELKSLSATRPELEKFLKKLPGRVRLFVEACRSWEWVSDLCEDRGFEMQLVDAAKMPEIWKCTKKTDKQDVESMFDRLLLTGRLPKAYRASRPQRELRGLTRRLEEFRKRRRNTLNQIHAVIDAQGMPSRKGAIPGGRVASRGTGLSAYRRVAHHAQGPSGSAVGRSGTRSSQASGRNNRALPRSSTGGRPRRANPRRWPWWLLPTNSRG